MNNEESLYDVLMDEILEEKISKKIKSMNTEEKQEELNRVNELINKSFIIKRSIITNKVNL